MDPIRLTGDNKKYIWKQIKEAEATKTPIKGRIMHILKDKIFVDIGGDITGITFNRLLKYKNIKYDDLQGKELDFIITKATLKYIYLDHRPIIKERAINGLKNSIKENSTVNGKIKTIKSYGAFVEIGDYIGLIHKSKLDEADPTKCFEVGKEYTFKVEEIEPEALKINLDIVR